MKKIMDYEIIQQLEGSRGSLDYRVKDRDGHETLIVKFLKTKCPSPSEMARFLQEVELIQRMDITGVVKTIDIKRLKGNVALILEDFEGVPLKSLIENGTFDLTNFLKIAIQVSRTLGTLHKGDVVHRNIQPDHILFNTTNEEAKITNFGAIAELTHENEAIYNVRVIRESLAYMSPEQSGRMNRTVDYRTDLYSLGIVFYEMLTGRIPFESDEPLGMIYSHIARKPVPLTHIDPDIPKVISDIVLKLLSKTADDRYQSGFGLMADLEKCMDQLSHNGEIVSFELGLRDIPFKFHISEKLVGREHDVDALMSAFDRVSRGGKEVMLVSGHPGVGKSALVNEIHKPIVAKKGYFVSGKCEPLARDFPYSSVINAFQKLVHHILKESSERVALWTKELLQALGTKGRVITEVIPEVKLIIGEQGEVIELSPEESQNRFNRAFREFTSVFATQDHPLVLFLDDLQWADSASLHLVENLITDENIRFLFFVGAYRDNEVSESHPLKLTLKEIKKAGVTVHETVLAPIDLTHVNNIIAELLRTDTELSFPLAEILFKKTGGNPFFLKQFIETLYQKGFLVLNPGSGWHYDMNKIHQMQVTDNVVDLMVAKIAALPIEVREVLEICACIGNRFDLETLSGTLGKSIEPILGHLNAAISQGVITVCDDAYMFHHDRIHEAAYSLIPQHRQTGLHLRIGKLALDKTSEKDLKDNIYYIVNQLNLGSKLLVHRNERVELARFNLRAGLKAKTSAAYEEARRFLAQGRNLLPHDAWESDYRLTLALYLESGEVEYLTGHNTQGEKLLATVLEKANSPLDKARVYEIKIPTYTVLHRYKEALQLGRNGLTMLGVTIPFRATRLYLGKELLLAWLRMRNRRVEDLINLPELTDETRLAAARILMLCIQPSYIMESKSFPIVVMKLLNLTLTYGNSPYATYAFGVYGAMLCGQFGRIEYGYRFGQLALKLLAEFKAERLKCRVQFIFGNFVSHWKEPYSRSLAYFREAMESGFQVGGDLTHTSYSILHYSIITIFAGETIDEILREFDAYYLEIKKRKQLRSIQSYELWYQLAINLSGTIGDRLKISGHICDEDEIVFQWAAANNVTGLAYYTVAKQMLFYFCGAFKDAVKIAETGRKYLEGMKGTILVPQYCFYESLALMAVFAGESTDRKTSFVKQVNANQKKMKKWATHAPENFANKYVLVEAEKSRIQGGLEATIKLYERAIALAQKNGFVAEEALANELAAKFCHSRGMEEDARMYMREARYGYERWGAKVKVRDLEENYRELLEKHFEEGAQTSIGLLDYAAVVSSLQAISTEIILEDLLKTLMKIVMEAAGAERGFFLSVQKDELYVEAEAAPGLDEAAVFKSIPVQARHDLALSVINYSRQTMNFVVLDDAATNGDFTTDPYVMGNRPKSILCLPVIRQSKLVGILYLENNIASAAFTPNRIELLKLLASQAAISFENARLYDNVLRNERALKQSEEKYRMTLASVEDGYYEIDTSGHFTLVNDSLCKMLGYARDEILATNYQTLMEEENFGKLRQAFDLVFSTEKPIRGFDNEIMTKAGDKISTEVSISLVRDSENNKTGFRGIVRDITSRKRIAEELTMHRDHLEELVKERTAALLKTNEKLQTEVDARTRVEKELMLYRDQLELLVKKRTAQLTAANEQLRHEIRDRRHAEEEAKLRQEQLFQAAKMASLGTLVSGVAHEINNPISFITLNAPILQKAWDGVMPILDNHFHTNGDFRVANLEYTELRNRIPLLCSGIVEGAKRVRTIVKDLKEFARQSPSELADMVNVNRATTAAVALVSNLIKKTTNRFSEFYKEDVPVIKGNAQRIEQVIINLLVNACQSLSDKEKAISISTAHDIASDCVMVEIQDEGQGMSAEVLERIRDPFFTTKRDSGGTGLGLAISDRIVTDHGGQMVFYSTRGQGTIVRVCFPVNPRPKEEMRF